MPQRLLKPALRQSKRWNRSPYLAQLLYVRLLMLVDDYARYDADAELLASECFPSGDPDGQPIPMLTIDSALLTLASKDMLLLYECDGKRYLQLTRWQERVRSESKWPDPKNGKMLTFDNTCQQMTASPPSPSPSPQPPPDARKTCATDPLPMPTSLQSPEFVREWQVWMTVRRGMKRCKDWVRLFQSQLEFLEPFGASIATQILKQSIRNDWQGLFELKNTNGHASKPELPQECETTKAYKAAHPEMFP